MKVRGERERERDLKNQTISKYHLLKIKTATKLWRERERDLKIELHQNIIC